jgi:hypothetical protein
VLLLALTIRVVYNLFFFQHRICDIGDSSYYLTAGKALADLVRASWSETHLSDFLVRLCQPTSVIPGSFQSFSSTNLSDRLLLDGPIFPSYLAGLFLLIGAQAGAAANLALNAHSQFYAIANSVVDSFSCAIGLRLCEFGLRSQDWLAWLALVMALYAPSIINTQQCYGEPFAYFLLCCWALLACFAELAGWIKVQLIVVRASLCLSELLFCWLCSVVCLCWPNRPLSFCLGWVLPFI